ncbi:MAG: ATP-binding protein [Chitinispirillaceae bacterium]
MIDNPVRFIKSISRPPCSFKNWIFRLTVILVSSLGFAAAFWILLSRFRHLVTTNVILVPAVIIAWKWGSRAGLLSVLANTVWINIIVFQIDRSLVDASSALLGISSYLFITFLIGTAGTLIRKLINENKERVRVEEQLRRYQEQLEEMVEERTKELTRAQEKISQIEKMEAIGQLAGGIAHDFNNQLAVIMGYSDILTLRLKNPKFAHFARQIHTSGTRARDLTKQLLAFSRKSSYKPGIVDMNFIVTEVVSLLSKSIDKDISLLHVLDAQYPKVWGSASHLQNAVLNLAINARDAMSSGGVLSIETSNMQVDEAFSAVQDIQLNKGDYICIAVSDTGTGIDPSIRAHMFEPFFTTKEKGKGTGMGLAAVYGTVQSHEGSILVDSEPGKGSTFKVMLPVTSRKNDEKDCIDELKDAADGEHVLIGEDGSDLGQMLSVILESLNYRTTISCDEKGIVELYKNSWRDTDAILLDSRFAEKNKLHLALKKINPDVTIILTSGFTSARQVEAALNEGVSAYLQIPFTRREIHRKIQECLTQKNTACG